MPVSKNTAAKTPQGLPKKKSNGSLASSTSSRRGSPANGKTSSPKSNSKTRTSPTLPRATPKPRRPLSDWLMVLALLFFSAYAIQTCPGDHLLQDPVCRGLNAYKETYVMPAVQRVRALPGVHQAEKVIVPTYQRVVVPAYTEIIRPVYLKGAVPLYYKKAHPHLEPYIAKARLYYDTYGRPVHVRLLAGYVITQAYVIRTYDAIQPAVVQSYHALQPYARAAWNQGLVWVSRAKQAYVDPHVGKMWAKVMEGAPKPSFIVSAKSTTSEGFVKDPTADVASGSSEDPAVVSDPAQSATPVPMAVDSSGDIDDFLLSLGVVSSQDSAPEPEETVSISPPPADPKTIKEEIAEKREKIKARHAVHREAMIALIDKRLSEVHEGLTSIRTRAASVMFGQTEDTEPWDYVYLPDGQKTHIHEQTNWMKTSCQGLLNGLNGYLDREQKGTGSGKDQFDLVLSKVEERWGSLTAEAQDRVLQWVRGVKQQEFQVCLDAEGVVRARAERAQADLGLDYAWLEDVTTKDWKEYHALMGLSKNFTKTVKELQETTDRAVLADPFVEALPRLQDALKLDITACYTQINEARAKAEKVFGSQKDASPDSDGDDSKKADLDSDDKADARPLSTDPEAFLHRGEDEVVNALRDVPLAEAAHREEL